MSQRPMSARRSSLTTSVEVIYTAQAGASGAIDSLAKLRGALSMLGSAIPAEEAEELTAFLRDLGGDEEIDEIFREINKSKSGAISLQEWRECEFFEDDD